MVLVCMQVSISWPVDWSPDLCVYPSIPAGGFRQDLLPWIGFGGLRLEFILFLSLPNRSIT
jgi:hypothetical protein